MNYIIRFQEIGNTCKWNTFHEEVTLEELSKRLKDIEDSEVFELVEITPSYYID